MNARDVILTHFTALSIFFGVSPAYAKPPIEWNAEELVITQMKNTQKIYSASLHANADIKGVEIVLYSEITPWITISPTMIGDLTKDQHIVIKLVVNLPLNIQVGTNISLLHIRQTISGSLNKDTISSTPIRLTVTDYVKDDLPPDPGSAGKATLLGVDSDSDGVRDDIQRYIVLNYQNQKTLQLALLDYTKQYQQILATADDIEANFFNANKLSRHQECLIYITGTVPSKMIKEIHARQFNTRSRTLTYFKFDNSLAGGVFPSRPTSQYKNSCAFDVDAVGGVQ